MKLARQWDVNYNGGVVRFTPIGEQEQVVIWQTSNMTSQQHSSSATFSATTSDGRQAWLNVGNDGKVKGAGYHGATPDSYLRCGDAQNNVQSSGLESKLLSCRNGVALDDDGNPNPGGPIEYTFESWQIDYDFSVYPYKSIVNVTRPEFSFGDYTQNFSVDSNSEFGGAPATAVFPGSGFAPPVYFFVNEQIVGATKAGRFTFQTGWQCGNF